MARKPSDIVQPNLRIQESLRRRLEAAAKQHGISINREMTDRLMASFVRGAHRTIDEADRTIDETAARIERTAERIKRAEAQLRFAREQEDRILQEELMQAGDALLAQIEHLPAEIRGREALQDAVEQMRTAIAAIANKYGRMKPDWEEE